MRTSEKIDLIAAALVAFQAELEAVAKASTNPHLHNKYASLDAVWAEIRPKLAKHDLAVIQAPVHDPELGRTIGVETRVIHKSGQWYEESVIIPIGDIAKGRNLAQEVGSSITYLRRYTLQALLGICAEEDDDGGGRPPAKKPPAKKPPAKKKATPPMPDTLTGDQQQKRKAAAPRGGDMKVYWDELGPIERACYRSWDNVRGKISELTRYEENGHAADGVIKKLFPGFVVNGYPIAATGDDGKIRVNVYRTVKAYAELRDNDMDGDEAKAKAFQTAKNLAAS